MRLAFIRQNSVPINAFNFGMHSVSRVGILSATCVEIPWHMHVIMAHQTCLTRSRAIHSGQKFDKNYFLANHANRYDITARVFKMKLKALMDFIVKHGLFSRVTKKRIATCTYPHLVSWEDKTEWNRWCDVSGNSR